MSSENEIDRNYLPVCHIYQLLLHSTVNCMYVCVCVVLKCIISVHWSVHSGVQGTLKCTQMSVMTNCFVTGRPKQSALRTAFFCIWCCCSLSCKSVVVFIL